VVKRKSDLPVGGFIVLNNEILDVKFTYNWKNAEGIEKLDAPSSEDRYDYMLQVIFLINLNLK
jgi:hypothetical protein